MVRACSETTRIPEKILKQESHEEEESKEDHVNAGEIKVQER